MSLFLEAEVGRSVHEGGEGMRRFVAAPRGMMTTKSVIAAVLLTFTLLIQASSASASTVIQSWDSKTGFGTAQLDLSSGNVRDRFDDHSAHTSAKGGKDSGASVSLSWVWPNDSRIPVSAGTYTLHLDYTLKSHLGHGGENAVSLDVCFVHNIDFSLIVCSQMETN